MNPFHQAPFVRLLIPFVIGILLAMDLAISVRIVCFLGGLLFPVIVFFTFSKRRIKYFFHRLIYGGAITLFIVLLGFSFANRFTPGVSPRYYTHFIHGENMIEAIVTEVLPEKEHSFRLVMDVVSVKNDSCWEATNGHALFYFTKDSSSQRLLYGDKLLIRANFREIVSRRNPGGFDYSRYLKYKGIIRQVWLKDKQWVTVRHGEGNQVLGFAQGFRKQLLKIFEQNHLEGEEFAVAAALILGYTDQLDPEIINAYAGTGTLHVLSVSGLHVGLLYGALAFLLSFLNKMKYGSVIKALVVLLLLWFYAVLTGLSPSVLRSVVMFSFIVIGNTFNRSTNIYNTLAVSAFFLLLLNPFLIKDVGFQLSYIAVAGIVYLHPKIYSSWEPSQGLLKQLWALTSVSLAAQLATFPLGLYYFHQFPNYFLVSNLVVIPLSTLVTYLGMALLIMEGIPWISFCFAKALWASTFALNSVVKFLNHLPFSVSQGIFVSTTETIFIYMLLLLLIGFVVTKRSAFFFTLLIGLIIFLSLQVCKVHSHQF